MVVNLSWPDTHARRRNHIIVCSVSIATGIACCIGLFLFWRKRNHVFIRCRHPILVACTCLSLIFTLLFQIPLAMFVRLDPFSTPALQHVRFILHVSSMQVSCLCVFARIHITSFDVSYAKETAKSLWVNKIDAYKKVNASWIVRHYNTWGNLRKVRPFYVLAFLIMFVMVTVLIFIAGTSHGRAILVHSILYFALNVSMIIVWVICTPRYLDQFKVRVEIRLVLCLQMIVSAMYCSYFISSRVSVAGNQQLEYMPWFFHACFVIVVSACLVLVQTWWVLYKLKVKEYRDKKAQLSNMQSGPDNNAAPAPGINIFDVIREPMGFESFMSHLAREFSTENLLAIIEFAQYKTRFAEIDQTQTVLGNAAECPVRTKIMTKISEVIKKSLSPREAKELAGEENDGNGESDLNEETAQQSPPPKGNKMWNENERETSPNMSSDQAHEETALQAEPEPDIKLPDGLPFSSIVYGAHYSNKEQDKDKAFMQTVVLREWATAVIHKLYEKYIVVGTELELNLSGRVRTRCFKNWESVNELNEKELYHIFDRCMMSVMKLMQDSYARFQTTKEFMRYKDKAQKRKRDNSRITGHALGGMFDALYTEE